MSLLLFGPPELVSRVLQSCDNFRDALALAVTCKRVQLIWVHDLGNIILQVGRGSVLSFDEALIVVRSTQIVKEAHEKGVLPPEIDIQSLRAELYKPTASEAEAVLNLRHLARYFEHKFLLRSKTETSWGRGAIHLLDESPQLLPIFKENFHRALYRLFILYAVLSRAYLKPFFEGQQSDMYDFLCLTRDLLEVLPSDIDEWVRDMPMTPEEVEHFCRHPIYNFTPHPGWEDCFGPLGDWLIGETRKQLEKETRGSKDNDGAGSVDGQALREVMQLLVIYGQMEDMKSGIQSHFQDPFWVRHFPNENGVCMCHTSNWDDETGDRGPSSDSVYRRLHIVFSRGWEPLEVQVRAPFSELDDGGDFFYHTLKRGEEAPEMPDVIDILEVLHCMSDRPNRVNGHSAPHPPLHLFTFLLRKYFDYQFDDLAFEMNIPKPIYKNFIQNGRIFTPEGNWDGRV